MYQKFDLLGINTSMKDKKVYIECTLDVEELSVTIDTITLTERSTNRILNYDLAVIGSIIELQLKEWPVPNVEYSLIIQTQVKSITEEPLSAALKRNIVFLSEITSTVVITSPCEHEEVNSLKLAWTEKPADKNAELVNAYYIEVANENAFYNIVRASTVYDKKEVVLTGIPEGQYYMRVRAQNGDQCGRWSDIVTFLYKTNDASGTMPTDDEPVYDEELVVVSAPINGETPDTFLFEFDEDLDMDGIEIVITRRTI